MGRRRSGRDVGLKDDGHEIAAAVLAHLRIAENRFGAERTFTRVAGTVISLDLLTAVTERQDKDTGHERADEDRQQEPAEAPTPSRAGGNADRCGQQEPGEYYANGNGWLLRQGDDSVIERHGL